ncbi:uncharacterized protein LOC143058858 [Mytilus galloprovincialis]|uniref:uncharacterized protein LOC143058858 n=1 Tax=Mytilus galloprovincialis TaxID=29158 RepID=UPI003F7C4346
MANDEPTGTHEVTNYPDNPLQNTKAQTDYSFNNLNVSIQNKGCTNEFQFIIVCIASSVAVVIVIVTLLGIVLSQYYKIKYRKQDLPEIEITNDYEEIDSTNSDVTHDAHIIINPRQESHISTIRIEEINRPSDAIVIDKNASKCLTQSTDEYSVDSTHWQSAIDYENDTFTCYTDEKNQDDYLHPYVGLGPQDYLSPYQPLQLQQSYTDK